MPFRYHAEHRHHIRKPRYRVTNRAEYDASLKRRGSLTVWFTGEAIQAWRAGPRSTPGGQPHYSTLAITTALTGRMAWQKASRYNVRAKVEATIGGYKRVIGDALRSRTDQTEATEVTLAAVALNRTLGLGRPNYVRID